MRVSISTVNMAPHSHASASLSVQESERYPSSNGSVSSNRDNSGVLEEPESLKGKVRSRNCTLQSTQA